MSLTCQHPQKNENNEDQLIHSAFFCGCWPRVTGKFFEKIALKHCFLIKKHLSLLKLFKNGGKVPG